MLKHTLLPSLSLASRRGWFITHTTRGLRPISTTTTNIKASSTIINFYSLHTILSFPQLPSSKINLLKFIDLQNEKQMSSSEHYMFGTYKIHQNEVFYSTQLSYAFVNLRPVVPGTCLSTSSLLFLQRPISYFLRLEWMSVFVCLFVFTVFVNINPFRLISIRNEILFNF